MWPRWRSGAVRPGKPLTWWSHQMCGLVKTGHVVEGDVPSTEVDLVARLFRSKFAADAHEYPVALRIAGTDQAFSSPRHDLGIRDIGECFDLEIADLGD